MSHHRPGIPAIIGAFLLLAVPAGAQIDPNEGPQVTPLQPEPTIGLPQQAPAIQSPSVTTEPQPVPAPATRQPPPPARPATAPVSQATANGDRSTWQLECIEQDNQPRLCQAILRAFVNDQVAMVVAIARPPELEEVRLQMALPLGIDMQRGAQVTIGDFSETLTASRCTAQGCLVEAAASEELLDAMREGTEGVVRVHAPGGDAIDLPMPLISADEVFAQAFSD